ITSDWWHWLRASPDRPATGLAWRQPMTHRIKCGSWRSASLRTFQFRTRLPGSIPRWPDRAISLRVWATTATWLGYPRIRPVIAVAPLLSWWRLEDLATKPRSVGDWFGMACSMARTITTAATMTPRYCRPG